MRVRPACASGRRLHNQSKTDRASCLPFFLPSTDTAAIASELAGQHFGLDVLEKNIEDDDSNFTRFLLLSRQPISSLIPPNVPAKTSIVFITPNTPGALYKALACFTLRDIDFCKIESRPTSPQLFRFLQYQQRQLKSAGNGEQRRISQGEGHPSRLRPLSGPIDPSATTTPTDDGSDPEDDHDLPRFRYCFYLDFLASQLDEPARNAILQLEEQSQYVRVLGSFPTRGQLLGPIREALDLLAKENGDATGTAATPGFLRPTMPAPAPLPKAKAPDRLKIGVIGFGKFGQFLTKTFTKYHDVYVVSRDDMVRCVRACVTIVNTISRRPNPTPKPTDGRGGGPGRQVLPALRRLGVLPPGP